MWSGQITAKIEWSGQMSGEGKCSGWMSGLNDAVLKDRDVDPDDFKTPQDITVTVKRPDACGQIR